MGPNIPETVPSSIRAWPDGTLRVGDSRVLAWLILLLHRTGESAEHLHHSFPSASLADVYGTIAHYYRERETFDPWLDEIAREGEEQARARQNDPERIAFRERITARWAAMQDERSVFLAEDATDVGGLYPGAVAARQSALASETYTETMTVEVPLQVPASIWVDERGSLRVRGSRVQVDGVLTLYLSGESPENIAASLTTASLADIYGTIAYYHANREQMDAYLEQCRQETEAALEMWRNDERSQATQAKFLRMRDEWRALHGPPAR